MNRRGLVAKENFHCCLDCAGREVTNLAARRVMKGKVVRGCCFYTEQDEVIRRSGDDFYLAYGPLDDKDLGIIGLPTDEVGTLVCECLDHHGVQWEWNKDPTFRILVKTDSIRPVVGFRTPEFSLN
jgi:hypothetical protein